MVLYVNGKNEIKDVNVTTDKTLRPLEIVDEWNPFLNWPVAKICCYRVSVSNGIVTMMTPYVDTRLMEHIAKLGSKDELIEADVTNTQIGLVENYGIALATAEEVTDCQLALVEVYNLLLGGM